MMQPRKLRDLVYEQLGKRVQVDGVAHYSIAALEYRKIANNQSIKELLNKSVCTRNNLLYIDFMMC